MVVLALEDGSCFELPIPSKVTIGRGASNNIQPESQSVSKNHAAIILQDRLLGNGVEAWVEDYDSRNGTFVGPNPNEMEKVSTRRNLKFGDYLRFGNAQKFHRFLEFPPPVDVTARDPDIPIVRPLIGKTETVGVSSNGGLANSISDLQLSDQQSQPTLQTDLPQLQQQQQLQQQLQQMQLVPRASPHSQSLDRRGIPIYSGGYGNNAHLSRSLPDYSHMSLRPTRDTKNMTISITTAATLNQPVAITIDPATAMQANNAGWDLPIPHQQQQQQQQQPLIMQDDYAGPEYGYSGPLRISDNPDWQLPPPKQFSTFDPPGLRQDQQMRLSPSPASRYETSANASHNDYTDYGLARHGQSQQQQVKGQASLNMSRNMMDNVTGGGGGGGGASGVARVSGGNAYDIPPQRMQDGLPFELNSWQADQQKSPTMQSSPRGYPNKRERGGGAGGGMSGHTRGSPGNSNLSLLLRSASNQPPSGIVNKPRKPPIRAHKVELVSLPSSAQVDWIINQILGDQGNLPEVDECLSGVVASILTPPPVSVSAPQGKPKVIKPKLKASSIPPSITAEVLAEDLLDKDNTVVGQLSSVIAELNDLVKQSFSGMNIDIAGDPAKLLETSAEFDELLQGLANSILASAMTMLQTVQQSGLVCALLDADDGSMVNNIGTYISTSNVRLARLHGFQSLTYLREECIELSQKENYEVQTFVLSKVLMDLDMATMMTWSIVQAVDNHVANSGALRGNPVSEALNSELEELRQLKKDAEEKARGQVNKDLVMKNMMASLQNGLVRYKFYKWKAAITAKKKQEHKKRAMERFVRALSSPIRLLLNKAFKKWEKAIGTAATSAHWENEIARLRCELFSANARIHELEKDNDLARSLMAERALNRELSSINCELRASIQQLETKLLEVASGPVSQRKCLVRDVLFEREEEVAIARREARTLREQLQQLQNSIETRPGEIASGEGVGNDNRAKDDFMALGQSPERVGERRERQYVHQTKSIPPPPPHPSSAAPAIASSSSSSSRQYARPHGNESYPPSSSSKKMPPGREKDRYGPQGRQVPDETTMSREMAKMVVLCEVRRLRQSYQQTNQDRARLRDRLIEETAKTAHLTTALQVLERRLTDRERSQNSLRMLLQQRIGDKGMLELMDTLEEMGAGKHALLKNTVPVPEDDSMNPEDTPLSAVNEGNKNNIDNMNTTVGDSPERGEQRGNNLLNRRNSKNENLDKDKENRKEKNDRNPGGKEGEGLKNLSDGQRFVVSKKYRKAVEDGIFPA